MLPCFGMKNFPRWPRPCLRWFVACSLILRFAANASVARDEIEFAGAVLWAPGGDRVDEKAIQVLREEIEKRTGVVLRRTNTVPSATTPFIAVGRRAELRLLDPTLDCGPDIGEHLRPEGFSIVVQSRPKAMAVIAGADGRGVLYGVGRFLRQAALARARMAVPADWRVQTAPKFELRGHQLGYRPKVNAYDAWSSEQFDQYIRELALFGANSIEILPPRTDDERTSRHMKLPPMEMMIRLSEVIDSYGLDVWIWYPNMGKDYVGAAGLQAELAEREEIFRRLKRIDHILVPGGDPGNLHPDVLFPWLEKMAAPLRQHHPRAKIWVSPQAFAPTRAWLDSFYGHVNRKPAWLGGVAFAPWAKTPLPEMRAIVDASLKIRNYPDITHSVECQYPVPNWDLAFALTLHRECYNPRPVAMKVIHNRFVDFTCGTVTYTEGINDDFNKFVWGDQDWDPATPVINTVRDYCRLFIDPGLANELADGFFALERNWDGALAGNPQVDVTLRLWQDLERQLGGIARTNYRFQMGLLRAHYDAYVKARLIHETWLEVAAREALQQAPQTGAMVAMERAENILAQAQTAPVAQTYKAKCEALADLLFAEIGSQLTVKRHGAQSRTRGAFMDGIDEPLNDVAWLRAQFKEVRALDQEDARLRKLDEVLNRTNPGPGGYYDSLGEPSSARRIVNDVPWAEDPGTLKSPRVTFYYDVSQPRDAEIPSAWKKQVRTVYELPLRLTYDNLDPNATYRVRATYSGRTAKQMRLVANGTIPIAQRIENRNPPTQEFPIPAEATRGGRLELTWTCGEGQPGCEVAEVWLLKLPGRDSRPNN